MFSWETYFTEHEDFYGNSNTVIFLGPPSKPNGPLIVDNVTKDQATLKWKEPTDTGGNPIRQVSPLYYITAV